MKSNPLVLPEEYLTNPQKKNTYIYVSTIQRMVINLFGNEGLGGFDNDMDADKLPQSVLAKAFRGELVPQDPNDEPAEKLLERIKEEKTLLESDKKTKKRTARKGKKSRGLRKK